MKPATEILLSAAFALTPKENWTQGVIARDESSERVMLADPAACKFCAAGAIWAATDALGLRDSDALIAVEYVEKVTGTLFFGHWNDTHTHAEVLAALYKAAEIAEAS